jgi:hypothetical protein
VRLIDAILVRIYSVRTLTDDPELERKRFRDVALSDLWMTRAVVIDRYGRSRE